jgi:tetratricopeptide (TPR) repeat protein
MLLASATLLLALTSSGDPDLELASALARRGWVELAEELCDRIEKNPAASAAARAGVPMVLAEVAVARARVELDVLKANKELEVAIERFNRPNQSPTLDERGMIGWLHVQRAKILSSAATDDPARRPTATSAWEKTAAFYRASLAELEKMPANRAVEEAMLDARLELPKALAAQARVPGIDPALRRKLLDESVRGFSDVQFAVSLQPILLEALLEEGRSRLDLEDYPRAERCFRELLKMKAALRKAGFPASEYQSSLLNEGVLLLARTLTQAKKAKEAINTCDEFLRENPRLVRSAIGWAVTLAKADAVFSTGDRDGATALAESVVAQNPDGPAGALARTKIAEWNKNMSIPPQRVMTIADDLMDRGKYRDALIELRRVVESCKADADRAKFEPLAAFKRGECFRALKQEAEASVAYQEVFRKYPKHELAQRAAFEAVRALMRNSTGDRREDEQMEKLLNEVDERGLGGDDFLKYIRAELLERKGQLKAAADLFRQVGESCPVFDEAQVSGGHDYRRDVEQRWEKARGTPAAREELVKQLGQAESMLRKALPRLEAAGRERAKTLATAYYDLASISLHESVGKNAEALVFLKKCAGLLPPESEMLPRLSELEVQAQLSEKNLDAASAAVDHMLKAFPDSGSTSRSCRRVAQRYEATDAAKSAKYYQAWMERTSTIPYSTAELQVVADGLYRTARSVNRFGDAVRSVMDLKGKDPADRATWKSAAEAHEMLLQAKDLGEKDAAVAATHLAYCTGFMAASAADWTKARNSAENVLVGQGLLNKNGIANPKVLADKKWLLGIYLEYGHSLYQLGKAGQKFQFGNALTVFGNVVEWTEAESEPWWIGRYMGIRCFFERGEGADITQAAAGLSLLEGNRPGFDNGKYGMKERFLELRAQVRAASAPQR